MADAGLLGLEVDHPDHTPDQRAHLRALADGLGPARHRVQRLPRHQQARRRSRACTTEPDQFEALLAAGTGSAPLSGD